jgi:hypothetical protein
LLLALIFGTGACNAPPTKRAADQIAGRVVDEQGKPLAGVEISVSSTAPSRTDRDGRFSIQTPKFARPWVDFAIRFSAPGFSPLTKDVKPGQTAVRRDAAAVWSPPICPFSRSTAWQLGRGGEVVSSWSVAFRIPRETQMTDTGQNEHGAHKWICRGGNCMIYATSPYDAAQPIPRFVDRFKALRERDVQHPLGVIGIEYRGRHHDGTYGRRVEAGDGVMVNYDHVSKESADALDVIIDSMCWLDRD